MRFIFIFSFTQKNSCTLVLEINISVLTGSVHRLDKWTRTNSFLFVSYRWREAKKSEQNLADTVTKLALSSKEADQVLKKVKVFESKCMNNEVTIEELDKNLRATTKMASDNEQKLDELSRKLGVQVKI